ncbi:MAG: 3-deoxy-7-phosphoheptulonate synthase [Lachnospiraceae bacterium]|nr:3-deoxy-7-phosphoheptulonate synthase [Lachnospiraceae bacterium]
MIVVLRRGTGQEQKERLISWLTAQGLRVSETVGEFQSILGLIGDVSALNQDQIEEMDMVESVKRISEPYKKANRLFHPLDSEIWVGDTVIGGAEPILIAGPCSVESAEQILEVAGAVKAAGAKWLRGGAFKPRTSPYDFQGMRAEGIELLLEAKKETGMPIVTEIMNANHLPLFEDVDVIQVGARNMQNFELLKELGMTRKPILLKRGLANTLKEFLMSAEYIMAGGNENVILCERGIRTFETATRNTLDLSAVPMLREMTHLPIVVDPSHATGISRMVEPMAMAAAAVGADGIMIEVHNDPKLALCDGPQSLTPDQFSRVAKKVKQIWQVSRC